jgi:hypothetical protein
MPRDPLLTRTLLLLLTLLISAAFAGASAARTAVAPVGGPSANNTVTKIQAWLEDQVSVSYSVRNWIWLSIWFCSDRSSALLWAAVSASSRL